MSLCSPKRRNTDVLKHCFRFTCDGSGLDTLQDIWINNGLVNACGTFILEAENICEGVRVFVNGEEVTVDDSGASTPIEDGETLALTVDDLESIQVICTSPSITTQQCRLNFCLTLHYECC
ncbi:S-Ena type endospore appendage [Pontibacillus sp. HMF3514]|uniref:S-Ena type endospore appendage n=1 Tax=Pontibacillus sp. HMF3514 TaxID=2692425 RepID=UPI00131FA8A7|nr:S-Ena type endospore appendage [Pontibacillus sp. HMF3514]QHE51635.1 DUF3992 domain-containing protein [Pontibacillus sp. HMF3514]